MQTRSMLPFLILVSIVSVIGAVLAMRLIAPTPATITQLVTVEILITPTRAPFAAPHVTVITATPEVNRLRGAVASDTTSIATLDPLLPTLDLAAAQALNPSIGETATALPANCLLHTIQSGETPFAIALNYGADPFLLLDANGLTEETSTQLQIGATLIIPLAGCAVDQLPLYSASTSIIETDAATEVVDTVASTADVTAAPENTPTTRPSPTITLAPTAATAQMQIIGVEKAGDVTAELVRIRNVGDKLNMTGWTLSDSEGNQYTFGEQLVFPNTEVMLYTRTGQNTPVALYWGLDKPVWQLGDVITLTDNRGQVQATLRIEVIM